MDNRPVAQASSKCQISFRRCRQRRLYQCGVFWEIAIKARRGKLDIGGRSAEELMGRAESMGFQLIGIEPAEAATCDRLKENTHFDPFDRMLICQAISRKMVLVSGDAQFTRFVPNGLKLLWK